MITVLQKATLSVVSFFVGVGATALAFRLGVDNGNPGEMVGPFLIAFAMGWSLGFAQALELVRKPYKLWTVVGQLFAGSLAMLAPPRGLQRLRDLRDQRGSRGCLGRERLLSLRNRGRPAHLGVRAHERQPDRRSGGVGRTTTPYRATPAW